MWTVEKRGDTLLIIGRGVEYFHDTPVRGLGDGTGYRLTDRQRLAELLHSIRADEVPQGDLDAISKAIKDYLGDRATSL